MLSDSDIRYELNRGYLEINPIDSEGQIQPCSVDLRLSNQFLRYRHLDTVLYIDPLKEEISKFMREECSVSNHPVVIRPGEFVLGSTVERVSIPDYLVGRVDGRSSIGRLGIIIHATAGFIDAGFEGTITLEISNLGKYPIALTPGMRICQISFDRLETPSARPYQGRYRCQSGPVASRLRDHDEL